MYGMNEPKFNERELLLKGYELAKLGFVLLEENKKCVVFVNNETGEEVEFLLPRDAQ